MQFIREFSHVPGNGQIRKSAGEKWMEWAPHIMALPENDNSTPVKNVLESYSGKAESAGK